MSTHVLDASGGGAVEGVTVELRTGDAAPVAEGVTDHDGRIASLAPALPPGLYRLSWHLGGSFLRSVEVTVELREDRHYHLPLLASPASAVAYLGV